MIVNTTDTITVTTRSNYDSGYHKGFVVDYTNEAYPYGGGNLCDLLSKDQIDTVASVISTLVSAYIKEICNA